MTLDDWWKSPRPWTDWQGRRSEWARAAQEDREQLTRSLGPTNTLQLHAARGRPGTLP